MQRDGFSDHEQTGIGEEKKLCAPVSPASPVSPISAFGHECSGNVIVGAISSPSFFATQIIAFRWTDVDLAWPGNLLFGIGEHLFPLRDPAGRSRDGKQHREDRYREPHRLVDQA